MKIATITCHRVYNHGAVLQAWALATFLKQLGHDVNIIDYRPDYLREQFVLKVNNPRFDKPVLRQLYLVAKYFSWKKSLARKAAFDSFDDKFIAPLVTNHCYLSKEELKQNPPIADLYIAGSDQIWNTTFKNGTDSSFYLNFGTDEAKRISYAASFATSSLKEGTEDFVRSQLACLDMISVREPSGVKLAESMGYNATLVCDPVFLISADIWANKIASRDGENEKYVLVYDFMCSEEVRKVATKIATDKGLKIFSVGPYRLEYADKCFINNGPDSFVALVKNATCVVSNSFHATAFSFIFNKNMFVVKRSDGLNIRMQDLLGRYGIIDHLVNSVSINELGDRFEIDYENVNPILQKEIEESKLWLKNQL